MMPVSADQPLLDVILREGPSSVADLARLAGVTPTAVRNRLARLIEAGLVDRRPESGARGRPRHLYQATAAAHRRSGQDYADLAAVLWDELMRTIPDARLRRLLFGRITERLADRLRGEVTGEGWEGRLVQLGTALTGRGIPAEVVCAGEDAPPVLKQHACPYFTLAEADHAICALERKMFEKVVGRGLRLARCRLDGARSCDFEPKPAPEPRPAQAG